MKREIIELRFIEKNGFMLELYSDGFIKVTDRPNIHKRLKKLGLNEEAELYERYPKTGCKTIRMDGIVKNMQFTEEKVAATN